MEIMNLCVLHLSDIERESGTGVDREELIQWYLEQREQDFETEEHLEYERELIAKALTKLAKVRFLRTSGVRARPKERNRTIICLRSAEMLGKVLLPLERGSRWNQPDQAGATRSFTLSVSDSWPSRAVSLIDDLS